MEDMNMKHTLAFAIACYLPLSASAQLIISEYVEGSGYNKAIELFNPTDGSINLSEYQIKLFQNGSTSASYTINLSGNIESAETFVVAHNDIDNSATVDAYVGNLLHNGDDAIGLYRNNTLIDIIGERGVRNEWGSGLASTKDNTIARNSSINQGSTVFDINNQWQGFAKNTISNLGSHQFTGSLIVNDGSSGGDGGTDNGGGDGGSDNHTANCSDAFTAINQIQGTGESSPLVGQTLWVEGIVTGDFQESGYKGFYIQSADAEQDSDTNTSEAIFVYSQTAVDAGDRIRLQATAVEFNNQTQLENVSDLTVCQTNVALPTAKTISLPQDANNKEALEGMLVTFQQPLFVTDTYNYGRYGQVGLATERLFTPTQVVEPGLAAQQLAVSNAAKTIILDDVQTEQNPEVLPYPSNELTANNSLRSGDSVIGLTGVLAYAFNNFQILPIEAVNIQVTNPRPTAIESEAEANLVIASFNVLNYFNGDGFGGGFPTPRGANNLNEFQRQQAKIVAAMVELNADVIGLMELENDGFAEHSAIADLVSAINQALSTQEYAYIIPQSPFIGDDAITVGILYRKSAVTPVGAATILDSSNSIRDGSGALFLDSKNRPMLSQQFKVLSSEQNFVVAVNHLKSKGSNCNSLGDPDLNDGQGNCNKTRARAAMAMGEFLQSTYQNLPTIIVGDLNAYAKEEPLDVLANNGFNNLFNSQTSYSYFYKGQQGQLDHALANQAMQDKLVSANIWHINADEPRVLDYNTDFQGAIQQAKFYAPDAYRSSDHDPIIARFNLVAEALLGDFDGDGDVDRNDVQIFNNKIRLGEQLELSYDFNGDNNVDRRDIRGLMALCTRSRCATEL